MARKHRTIEELRNLASVAEEIAKNLRKTADRMEEVGYESALVHGATYFNTWMPKIRSWAIKLLGEFEAEYRAVSGGKMSEAEYNVRKNRPGGVSAPDPEFDKDKDDDPPKKKSPKKKPPKK